MTAAASIPATAAIRFTKYMLNRPRLIASVSVSMRGPTECLACRAEVAPIARAHSERGEMGHDRPVNRATLARF